MAIVKSTIDLNRNFWRGWIIISWIILFCAKCTLFPVDITFLMFWMIYTYMQRADPTRKESKNVFSVNAHPNQRQNLRTMNWFNVKIWIGGSWSRSCCGPPKPIGQLCLKHINSPHQKKQLIKSPAVVYSLKASKTLLLWHYNYKSYIHLCII